MPEYLTIDVTVARDYLDPDAERHSLACALFDLARRGDVELASATSGYLYDVEGDLEKQIGEMFDEEGVVETGQLSYPGERTLPGQTLFPGAYVKGLDAAWDAVVADWKPDEGKPPQPRDRLHVESHVLRKRDVFITDNKSLLVMCRRLRDEHGIAVEATSLGDYIDAR
jgi:hypothetical protein